MSAGTWDGVDHILCVRLDTLGDVLMTTPAIRALRETRPGRRITLLTSHAGAEVARLIPEIDNVIVYEAPWMKHGAGRVAGTQERDLVERLQREGFGAAVIFTVYSQNPLPSALLCYLAGIPLSLAHCHENPYALLSNWIPDPEPHETVRHEVRRQLDLVGTIGARTADPRLSLRVPEAALARVPRLLQRCDMDPSRPWLIIHPGATAASRRYPPESFAMVARRLTVESGYQVLFTGSPAERDLVAGIQALMGVPSHSSAGDLALDDLAALIARSPLLIANNTGPVHIAAAVGTPVVDLYALTNPQHTPWRVPNRVLFHDVPCKYCYKSVCPQGHHHCLRLVTPDSVVAAVHDLLLEQQAVPITMEASR